MTHISKHDSEQEGERNASEKSRVGLFVHRLTIGVNNFLESPGKLIGFNVGGRDYSMLIESFECCGWVLLELLPDHFFISARSPKETNVISSAYLCVIQSMV